MTVLRFQLSEHFASGSNFHGSCMLTAERLGDCWMDAFICTTFFGVVMVKGQPDGFIFSAICRMRNAL